MKTMNYYNMYLVKLVIDFSAAVVVAVVLVVLINLFEE